MNAFSELIAKELWPELRLEPNRSPNDKLGIDGWLGGKPVQIKKDSTIAESGNLYHEIYEKSVGRLWQKWRHSPTTATFYIFVTHGFAVLVPTDELAQREAGRRLCQIKPTSKGFIIPLREVEQQERKPYNHTAWQLWQRLEEEEGTQGQQVLPF